MVLLVVLEASARPAQEKSWKVILATNILKMFLALF
jgi:hypothetical protein